jgi:hypothetical protein
MRIGIAVLTTTLLVPMWASAQTTEPSPASVAHVSASVGLSLNHSEQIGWFPQAGARLTWTPLSFLGLNVDAYGGAPVRFFPWAWSIGARVGPVLKWPLGLGPVSPFVTAQVGWVGLLVLGAGADGGKATVGAVELSTEAGVEIPLVKLRRPGLANFIQFFLSMSGGARSVSFTELDHERYWFGRLAFGVGL